MASSPPNLVKSVRVQNFKCLGDVTVQLAPLTVLIGKNDTGKTSFLEAIGHLASAPAANRRRGVFGSPGDRPSPEIIKRGEKESHVHCRMSDGSYREITIKPTGVTVSGESEQFLANVQLPYRFDLSKLRAPATVGVLENHPLPPDGEHFAAAVDRLPNKRFNRLQDELISRLPLIEQLVPASTQQGMKEIWFDVKGSGRIPARQMSDGVMLVLAVLTVLHDENAPKLVMLEEPETGVHPKQLERLVEAFNSISAQGVQIVLSTHSPYLLDFVQKDSVRVFTRRDEDGQVTVKPFSEVGEIRDMLSRGYTLGEAWYNSDEDAITGQAEKADRRTK